MSELLAWVDVETTGLDPTEGLLLQVACILTDLEGNIISEPYEAVIHQDRDEAMNLSNDYVKEMHATTGLWDKLATGEAPTVVDHAILEGLMLFAPEPRSIRLAGNSVRLDLNFLERNLPKTYAHLHYRSVDVTALAYALQAWGVVDGKFEKRKTHDALEDIRESIAEYRWLRAEVSR